MEAKLKLTELDLEKATARITALESLCAEQKTDIEIYQVSLQHSLWPVLWSSFFGGSASSFFLCTRDETGFLLQSFVKFD